MQNKVDETNETYVREQVGKVSAKHVIRVHQLLTEYESRHEKVMDRARKGIRHHLKGNFSDHQYTEDEDNIMNNCNDCVLHQKGGEFYEMFEEELARHSRKIIVPKLRFTKNIKILQDMASSWLKYKQSIKTCAGIFEQLIIWIKLAKGEGRDVDYIETLGPQIFKKEVVSHKEISEKLASILTKRCEEHKKGSDVDKDAIKELQELLVEFKCYDFSLLTSGITSYK